MKERHQLLARRWIGVVTTGSEWVGSPHGRGADAQCLSCGPRGDVHEHNYWRHRPVDWAGRSGL